MFANQGKDASSSEIKSEETGMSIRYIDDTREVLAAAFDGEVSGDYFKIIEAMHVCLVAHHEQYRKQNRVMYALHPFRVFLFVGQILKVTNTDVLCACLLHDTLEDSGATADILHDQFGAATAQLVVELTRPRNDDREARRRDLIEHAKYYSNAARIVKCSDRIDNLADAYVNFGDKKLWHYTGEAIELYYAMKGSTPIYDDLLNTSLHALDFLRRTINEIIVAARQKRNIVEFDAYAMIR